MIAIRKILAGLTTLTALALLAPLSAHAQFAFGGDGPSRPSKKSAANVACTNNRQTVSQLQATLSWAIIRAMSGRPKNLSMI